MRHIWRIISILLFILVGVVCILVDKWSYEQVAGADMPNFWKYLIQR